MADTKISALTAATTPLAGTEVLPIVQSSTTKKVAVQDLNPQNVKSNATSGVMQIVGPAAAATRVMTIPDANFTAARTDAAQSFTGDQTLSNSDLVIGTSGKGIQAGFVATLAYRQYSTDLPAQSNHTFSTADQFVYVGTFKGSSSGNDQRLIIQGRGGEMAVFGQYGRSGITSPISGYVGTILADGTTFNKAMYWDTSGNITAVNGNFVQGTAAKGFDFSANSTAAGKTTTLLGWYEEGTWTPTVASSGGGTPTYTRQIGRYTRIGNRVFFQIEIDLATKGTLAAGNVSLTGLPYASNSTVANWASASVGLCDGFTYPAGANQLTAIVDYNSTVIYLYWIKSGAATINTVIADISATARINFSGHYMI